MSNRSDLLHYITEKKVSYDTQMKIARPMGTMQDYQKEERAGEIYKIAVTCETESELLQKLQEKNLLG